MKNIKYVLSIFSFFILFLTACNDSGGGGSSDSSSTDSALVLGRSSATDTDTTLLKGIGCAGKTATAGSKLFLVDICNSRVLIYNSIPTQNYQQPDLVLGQASLSDSDVNRGATTPAANTLNRPTGIATDGTHLIVSDSENHRVLIWNTIPTTNGQAADIVLGQADFVTNTLQSPSDSTFDFPYGLTISGTKLFVVDGNNHRVLIWNTIPTTNGQAANVVVGQSDFTSNTAGDVNTPSDVATDGTKLIIAGNQMSPTIWNTIPTTNGVAPDLNMGNDPTLSYQWNGVNALAIVSGKLIIVGDNGSGTYIWNSIPTSTPTYADHEIGTHTAGSPSALNMDGGEWVSSDGTRLFISDSSRLLIWNTIPTNNSTGANIVLGQPDMTTNRYNFRVTSAQSFATPSDVVFAGSKLIMSDVDNNRILIWNSTPTTTNQAADIVLGQPNMTSYSSGTSSTTLNGPWTVSTDGTRLMTADSGNSRVLIWNTIPTSSTTPADVVLGQPDMNSNGTGTTSTTLSYPGDVFTNGTIVAVADGNNHRVLIWNSIPSSNGAAADVVLGQPDMTSNTSAGGASGMSWPDSVKILNGKLFVSDSGNCRVLIWNTIPTTDGQPADVVIGQPDMITTTCGTTPTASTLIDSRMTYDSNTGRLYIADWLWNRILVWNTIPTTNGVAADSVIGQSNFTTSTGGSTASTFKSPWGLLIKDTFLWIADSSNHRVLKMALP